MMYVPNQLNTLIILESLEKNGDDYYKLDTTDFSTSSLLP